jgi:hypothetical protein
VIYEHHHKYNFNLRSLHELYLIICHYKLNQRHLWSLLAVLGQKLIYVIVKCWKIIYGSYTPLVLRDVTWYSATILLIGIQTGNKAYQTCTHA